MGGGGLVGTWPTSSNKAALQSRSDHDGSGDCDWLGEGDGACWHLTNFFEHTVCHQEDNARSWDKKFSTFYHALPKIPVSGHCSSKSGFRFFFPLQLYWEWCSQPPGLLPPKSEKYTILLFPFPSLQRWKRPGPLCSRLSHFLQRWLALSRCFASAWKCLSFSDQL